MSAIEALYIFDEHNNPILEHIYLSRPPSAKVLLPLYLAHPSPRPSVLYFPQLSPPSLCFSTFQDRLLFLCPSSVDIEPLLVLEFLHRVADALEEFLGSPLSASKIEGSYDVVAQLLGEMCDAGIVCNTEPNALRDVVEAPTWVGKLLSGVGLPTSSPALSTSSGPSLSRLTLGQLQAPLSSATASGLAIPWRRSNVRHTSNELYVDIVESLSVILAPSGRPISAFAHGTIAFTSKLSGVPDLLLILSTPSGKLGLEKTIELPVFHPCVRLARWKERPGELSFVPPDGRFVLMGYEVDLLPNQTFSASANQSSSTPNLSLPATGDVRTSLGPTGTDFEVRLSLSKHLSPSISSTSRSSTRFNTSSPAFGSSSTGTTSSNPSSQTPHIEDLTVTLPIPASVRNISDLRASKGEANYTPSVTTGTSGAVEWRISNREAAMLGSSGQTATLRCTVVGPASDVTTDEYFSSKTGTNGLVANTSDYYDDTDTAYQSLDPPKPTNAHPSHITSQSHKGAGPQKAGTASLMPSSALLSFNVKNYLASGIKVEKLNIDAQKSRGLGAGVQPYKGVKYLTVCRGGVERRC